MNFTQLSQFTPSSLVRIADNSFVLHYRNFNQQVGGRVHTLFNTAISDFDFLKIVIYNNDNLRIPPTETFLAFYEAYLPSLSKVEKQCIGGLFGNLFRFVFNYNTAKVKQYRNYTVGSASYFVA